MDMSVSRWALLSAFIIFIILGTSVPGELFSMFILGLIPGTSHTIPLWVAVTIYPVIALTSLYWVLSQPLYIGETSKPVKEPVVVKTTRVRKNKASSKQPTLKRRTRAAI